MKIRTVQFLQSTALAGMIAAFAVPAAAQTASPEQTAGAQEETTGDEITVTGSRLQVPGMESNSPITAIGSAEIRLQGATNVENVLNRLPQITPDANENVSNGADGTAKVNLRNLGNNRNLVLVNGQRLLPVQATDLNFIPSFLVDRIDVVTGGASAVYGSDAVSGVINFVLRDNLNGVKADAQYGFSNHRNDNTDRRALVTSNNYENALPSPVDGQRFDANIAFGTNFPDDRGNITAYFGYRNVKPILQANRDVSACALDPNGARSAFACGGSSNNPFGVFDPQTGPAADLGRFNNTRDGAKTWVPYNSTFRYNYAPTNYFQRNDTRYTAGAFAHYEVTPAAEIYGSVMFMDDRTNSQIAPSALFQGTDYKINCDNPLLSAQQGAILCGANYGNAAVTQTTYIGYRPVGGAARPRRDDLRHTDYRFSGGLRGEIAEGIRYDANALFSTVILNETYSNDIDPGRANKALQVVRNPVGGAPVCKSVLDGTDPLCIPIDVFAAGGISAAGLNYIYAPTSTDGLDKETVLNGALTADLTSYGIKSPWADTGVGAVFGVEHRRESLEFNADALARQKGTKESAGKFDVTEFFTEVRVPIVADRPFMQELTLTGGYRWSKYSTQEKGVSSYKGEISYSPIADIRLRGSYNRAIRAPNITELFGPTFLSLVTTQDPCAGVIDNNPDTVSPTATAAQCARTGVTAAQYGRITDCPSEQCGIQVGGNTTVKPEEADTYTAGIVLSPGFMKGLSVTVDYFNIRVNDYINGIPATSSISQCIATADPFYCSLIVRAPNSGVLFGDNGYVITKTQNTGSLKTAGIDIGATYGLRTGIGKFDLSFVGTWLDKLVTEPLKGLGSYDCKGLFGGTCGQPAPEWRHQARVSWTTADDFATLSLNWRYTGGTKLSLNTSNPFLTGDVYTLNAKLPSYSYFDLATTMKVATGLSFRAGVNNLLDKDPPAVAQGLLASFGNGNTYPGFYDVAGRSFFFGLTAEF